MSTGSCGESATLPRICTLFVPGMSTILGTNGVSEAGARFSVCVSVGSSISGGVSPDPGIMKYLGYCNFIH